MAKEVPTKKYTPEFKKQVVETMQKEKLSYWETANREHYFDNSSGRRRSN